MLRSWRDFAVLHLGMLLTGASLLVIGEPTGRFFTLQGGLCAVLFGLLSVGFDRPRTGTPARDRDRGTDVAGTTQPYERHR